MHPTLLLLQAPDESVSALGVALEYIGFAAYFFMFGALGFRYFVLGRVSADTGDGERSVFGIAAHRAAWIGLVGALLFLAGFFNSIADQAAHKQITLTAAIGSGPRPMTLLAAGLLFLLGYALALGRVRAGWVLAALGGAVIVLRNAIGGKWATFVNPVHEVAASVWLGTLLVLVVAGLPAVLRSGLQSERRGALVAALVARFSPVALVSAAVLGITGVITAWRHLKYVAALWTTPYGFALDVKLVLVAIVLALGAWNWKRMSPRLGAESAAHELRRSATAELTFAALVLVVTAVLVSLPAPKLPHP